MTVAHVSGRRGPSRRPRDGQGGAAWSYWSWLPAASSPTRIPPLTLVISGGGLFLRPGQGRVMLSQFEQLFRKVFIAHHHGDLPVVLRPLPQFPRIHPSGTKPRLPRWTERLRRGRG